MTEMATTSACFSCFRLCRPLRSGFLTAVLLLLAVQICRGQNALPTLEDVRQAYEHFAYDQADSLSRVALENYHAYSPRALAWIHIYRGSALFALGKTGEAKAEFAAALSLIPDLKLDPVYFSPKLIRLLEDARGGTAASAKAPSPPAVRYVLLSDPRPAAAWRSFFLPGWGQYFKGQKKTAYVLSASAGITAAGALWAYLKTRSAHQAYLQARQPAEIDRRYRSYRRFYRLRSTFAAAAFLVWAYSFWDALLSLPESPVTLRYRPEDVSVSFCWKL